MSQGNGQRPVPILGQRIKAGVVPMALIRHLDPDGTYDPEAVVETPAGPSAVPGRHNVVTADDLLAQMRAIIREELRAILGEPASEG